MVTGRICEEGHVLSWVEVAGEQICGEYRLQLCKLLVVLREPLEDLLLAEELSDGCCGVEKIWNEKGELLG